MATPEEVTRWDENDNQPIAPPWAAFANKTIEAVKQRHQSRPGFYLGNGDDRAYLMFVQQGLHPLAINLSPAVASWLAQHYPEAHENLFYGSFEQLRSAEVIDYIFAIPAHEHTSSEYMQDFLSTASRILEPQGEIFFRSSSLIGPEKNRVLEQAQNNGLSAIDILEVVYGGEAALEVVWQKPRGRGISVSHQPILLPGD